MKEAKQLEEIVVVSCGPKQAQDVLRTALAMGADRGIHVLVEDMEKLQPIAVAKLFAKIVELEKPELVILGKQVLQRTLPARGGAGVRVGE